MNLLPGYYKSNLKFEAWRRFFIFFGTYSFVVGIIAIMLLLPSYFFLQFQIDTLEAQLVSTKSSDSYQKAQQGNRDVSAANTIVNSLISFETAKPKIVVPLEDLLGRVLPGVVLNSISYTEKPDGTTQAQMGGVASQRNIYLDFIENIQKSPFVQSKIVPTSEELKKETNINFSISFTISTSKK